MNQWKNDEGKEPGLVDGHVVAPVASEPGVRELALAQITLLMRIYDVQMALLTEINDERASEIYAAHEEGGHFNPEIFIPSFERDSIA